MASGDALRSISISFGPSVQSRCGPTAGASVTLTKTGAETTNGDGAGSGPGSIASPTMAPEVVVAFFAAPARVPLAGPVWKYDRRRPQPGD